MLTAKKAYHPHSSVMSSNGNNDQDLDLEDIEEDIEFSAVDEEDDDDFFSENEYESKNYNKSSNGNRGKNNNHEDSHDDNRKDHHNQLERKRRASIKGSYNELKDTIPGLKGSKASRAVILQRAVECISDLSRKNKDHYQCVDVLMRENEILERQVNDLQRANDRLENEDELMLSNNALNQMNGPGSSINSAYHRNSNSLANAADLPTFRTLNNSNASSAYSTSSDASSSNSSLGNSLSVPIHSSMAQSAKRSPPTSSLSSSTSSTPSANALQFVATAATDILQSIQSDSNIADSSPAPCVSSSSTTLSSSGSLPKQGSSVKTTKTVISKTPKILPGSVIVRRHIAPASSESASSSTQSIAVVVSSSPSSASLSSVIATNRPIISANTPINNANSESKTYSSNIIKNTNNKYMLKINPSISGQGADSKTNPSTSYNITNGNQQSISFMTPTPATTIINPGQSHIIRPGNIILKKATVISQNQVSSTPQSASNLSLIEPKVNATNKIFIKTSPTSSISSNSSSIAPNSPNSTPTATTLGQFINKSVN